MNNINQQLKNLPVSFAGKLIYRLLPYRRKTIGSNIDQVYGHQICSKSKQHLIKAYYSHLAKSVKEAIQLRFMSQEQLKQSVEVKGYQYLLDIVTQKKGVLILTGHFGNWEFAPIGGILNFHQFKGQFHFIRKSIGFKKLEQILFSRYYKAGLNVIPMKNSLNQVCDALDKNHAVVFVMDQHAILGNRDGIAVEFFGKKAGTYRSLASLSCYTGVPVVPAASYRLADGKHVLEFHEPIHWQDHPNRQEAIYQNTLAYNKALEKLVLAHPEQWHWMHKRWKLRNID
ncbi:lysophospholipid acyltransferase family protein [Legionella israelensis]|uniref:lysophospholipid acyltransferase family protein n=1 Tax=Legionella israelensis TaxID=454 RepID=UPI00117C3E47|nr:lysophospholipid acyltransferase family protein [Legionella israelensis]QDP71672.1 lysophospholipid acyltransferase family protein [Legionella israelensis]